MKSLVRVTALGAAVVALTLLLTLGLTGPAAAQSDTTGPTLEALSFVPASVDISASAQTVQAVASARDDLAGVDYIDIRLDSPSGNQHPILVALVLNSDGTFSSDFTFPRYAEAGRWTAVVVVHDRAGNGIRLSASELRALGMPDGVEVIGTSDLARPRLDALSLTPASVDISASAQTVRAVASVSDALAGVDYVSIRLSSPSCCKSISGTLALNSNGTFSSDFTFPRYAETGRWTADVLVRDQAGNVTQIDASGLRARGLPDGVEVTGGLSDLAGPTLESLSFTPASVNISASAQTVRAVASASDALAGVNSVWIALNSPSGHPSISGYLVLNSDGTFSSDFTFPRYAATGRWAASAYVHDRAGNVTYLSASALSALGLPDGVDVTDVSDSTPPAAPGTPQSFSPTQTSVSLRWTEPADGDLSVYHLYRDGELVHVMSAPLTFYTFGGLQPGTAYTFGVAAVDAAGNVSETAQVTASTTPATPPDTTPPAAPGNPQIFSRTSTSASLRWTEPADGDLAGYNLYRDGELVAIFSAPATFYTFTGLQPGTAYTFGVAAFDTAGNVSETAFSDSTPPTPPTNLTATATSSTSVRLTWDASTDNVGVAHYRITATGLPERRQVDLSSHYFDLEPATTYTFTIVAVDADGNESESRTDSVTTPAIADTTAPTRPLGFTAVATSSTAVMLSWSAASDNVGVVGYRIERDSAAAITTSATFHNVTGLIPAATYLFYLRTLDAAGNASEPAQVGVKMPAAPDNQAPTAPTNLTATPYPTSLALSWSASTDNIGVVGYRIYSGNSVFDVTPNTSFTVTGLKPSTTYTYGVAAYDEAGKVSSVTRVTATTSAMPTTPDVTPPSAPPGLMAETVNISTINLAWLASTDNVGVHSYRVFINGVATFGATSRTYQPARSLKHGTSYTFDVVAVDAAGNISARSSVTIFLLAPPQLTSVSQNATQTAVNIVWKASPGIVTQYQVFRSGVPVGTTTGLQFSDSVSGKGLVFHYTIRAYDADGHESPSSNSGMITLK